MRLSAPGAGIRRNDVVLAVLSEAFYADDAASEKLLSLLSAGTNPLLPLKIDGAEMPERIRNSLAALNIVPAVEREPEHVAERIISSIPQTKSRLPGLLIAGGAVLAVIAGLLIWQSLANRPEPSAVETEIRIPDLFGLTEEDLAKIEDVVIIGEKAVFLTDEELAAVGNPLGEDAPFIYVDADNYAVLDENAEDGLIHWYGMEDGQELSAVHYDDLRFIGLMPNLRFLSLVLLDVPEEGMPDLSHAQKLEGAAVMNCSLRSLDWLAGSSAQDMMIRFTPIADFGTLTACESLKLMHLDMRTTGLAPDFSSFAPPALETMSLWMTDFSAGGGLSFMQNLPGLKSLQILQPDGLTSLAGLEGTGLEEFEIVNGFELEDISALAGLTQLKTLTIDDCPPVKDYSPVGNCSALENVMIYSGWDVHLQDASFLSGLSALREIKLYSLDLQDLDFLRGNGQGREALDTFDFSGDVRDFSALGSVKRYGMLGIDLYGGSLNSVNADLSQTSVSTLKVRRVSDLDLASLPQAEDSLFIYECDIRDFSSLPEGWGARRLQLYNCSALRSLEGVQRLAGFREKGKGVLEVYYCPLLTDWSALNGTALDRLILNGVCSLPDFSALRTGSLRLENAEDVNSLDFLVSLDASDPVNFELLLDGVQSLEPLRRFHGEKLVVPPALEEQAKDLVKAGNFESSSVEYPRGGWQIDTSALVLESLDDLQTLPAALLRRVESVCLAGDISADPSRFEAAEIPDENGGTSACLRDRESGELIPLDPGTLTDVGLFSQLSGLRELTLLSQPLTSLNGIQNLMALESFRAVHCAKLRDCSALFALQSLTDISLRYTAVNSLQGVQNLYDLRRLDISHSSVTDLSMLTGLQNLEAVTVSSDMAKAISSLNGRVYGFDLIVTD